MAELGSEGRLPVINILNGGDGIYSAPRYRQAFPVGETSMAYYGTPKQVSKFNGDALMNPTWSKWKFAYECYGLFDQPAKIQANLSKRFQSRLVFSQPLPLGRAI